jgi:amidohydrolase
MKRIAAFALTILLMSMPVYSNDTSAEIDAAAAKLMPKVIEWRRHIHQYPELSNREVKTAKYVEDHLREAWARGAYRHCKDRRRRHSEGRQPGPVIGLRADMDGLPVTERNDLPFRSRETAEYNGQTVGVMHACGHDTHVAMLMGAAELLTGMKDKVRGTVVFIFQPAEEGPPEGEEGGAPLMIKEGVMDNPKIDAIFGIHINSQTPIGTIKYKSGAIMASSDWFQIKVKGKPNPRRLSMARHRPDRGRHPDLYGAADDSRPAI